MDTSLEVRADTAKDTADAATAAEASATADEDIVADSTDRPAAEGLAVDFQVTVVATATAGPSFGFGFSYAPGPYWSGYYGYPYPYYGYGPYYGPAYYPPAYYPGPAGQHRCLSERLCGGPRVRRSWRRLAPFQQTVRSRNPQQPPRRPEEHGLRQPGPGGAQHAVPQQEEPPPPVAPSPALTDPAFMIG